MQIRSVHALGQYIRDMREQANMTQGQLADAVEASRKWVSEIEGGKPTSEIGRILRALQVLGVALSVESGSPRQKELPADEDMEIPDLDAVLSQYGHRP